MVTIDQNGVATAQAPGSTLITGTIAQTSSNAGYFYTCPPAKIALSVASTGATSASVTLNTPLALTATVTDVNNNVINGLALSYVSTNPGSIAVSSTGAVTRCLPLQLGDHCHLPADNVQSCPDQSDGNPGHRGPGDQQFCADHIAGKEQQLHLGIQPGLALLRAHRFLDWDHRHAIKFPTRPTPWCSTRPGTTLYFGSYHELMTYSAATNSLTSEATSIPGVVLAVSPTNSAMVVNDQLRGVIYLYTPSSGSGLRLRGKLYLLRRNRPESGLHRRWPDRLHRWRRGALYPQLLHRLVGRDPACEPGPTASGVCPATNTTSPIPIRSHDLSAQHYGEPQQHLQHVLLPGSGRNHSRRRGLSLRLAHLRLWAVPRDHGQASSELSRSNHGRGCLRPRGLYHRRQTHHRRLRQSTDTDGSLDHGPDRCLPNECQRQTTGIVFNPPPVANQASLAAYGITNINQVVAATNSLEAFVTYRSAATTPPAGGALLPVYKPSAPRHAGNAQQRQPRRQRVGSCGGHLFSR